ncbi:MAG: DUF4268 domain-containing protein [Acidimicrobiia bacterium]|nr:DUF4268 domain-containing protein [Acidimicrobiia bacterium]
MPTRMALWRLTEDGAAFPVVEERLSAEALIESAVESAPDLLGVDVLIIGQQVQTPSGPLDLLAIDAAGQLVVVENKRDRTPREVLAQTIDYAAFIATMTFDEVLTIYQTYRAHSGVLDADLVEAFEERFGEPLDTLADTPRMIIVASRLDDSTERMIDFLADRFGVPVNAALFQPFAGGLVGRTWLRPEESIRLQSRAANTESREEAKLFWDAWLPVGRQALPGIRLPANGPRSVLIKRRIVPGVPAALTMWVSSSEAYAEVQFDDDDPAMNDALLTALKEKRTEIEAAFGETLDWRAPEAGGLMTKRTKVVTPKVTIGDRAHPTAEGLDRLANTARRLLAAVKPHLSECFDRASVTMVELDGSEESMELPNDELVDLGQGHGT